MKKIKFSRGLVTQSLEHISKEIFSKYSTLITKLIERSSGVYALYDENELYYVGRAIELRRRVKQHLKDRHDASWTHFSIFLIANDSHIGEIESLLVRIAKPKGNTVKPKGRDSRQMRKLLENAIKQKQKEELSELFSSRRVVKPKSNGEHLESLKGAVDRRTPIYRTFKGREHKAILTPTGTIILKGKKYSSPTGAAMSITKRTQNGWRFWYIRNRDREWVRLKDL